MSNLKYKVGDLVLQYGGEYKRSTAFLGMITGISKGTSMTAEETDIYLVQVYTEEGTRNYKLERDTIYFMREGYLQYLHDREQDGSR